jgi:hypothetical protein
VGARVRNRSDSPVSQVRLYLDEDAMRRSLVFGLRARGKADVLYVANAFEVMRHLNRLLGA